MPAPPYSAGNTIPISPSLPSSFTVAKGNSLASSHFITLGAISCSANSRTLFLSWFCSSFSRKSTQSSATSLMHLSPGDEISLEHKPRRRMKKLDRPVGFKTETVLAAGTYLGSGSPSPMNIPGRVCVNELCEGHVNQLGCHFGPHVIICVRLHRFRGSARLSRDLFRGRIRT